MYWQHDLYGDVHRHPFVVHTDHDDGLFAATVEVLVRALSTKLCSILRSRQIRFSSRNAEIVKTLPIQHRSVDEARNVRGAVLPLVAAFIVILFAMAAFSVDLAYIELVKTELRAATDSSARAAASALIQGASTTSVINTAISTAALNKVAGKSLKLSSADVTLGQSIIQPNGIYQFQAGVQPYQAVRVTSSLSSKNANGNVPLFFGSFMGLSSYSPTNTAVAAASSCDVCLVLDRSHSMCWDQTGVSWSYPAPVGLDTYGVSNIVTMQPSGLPSGVFQQDPPRSGSRWLALQSQCSRSATF